MKKAVILYNSRTGTTKKYAEEIGKYLETKEINAQVSSTQQYRPESLDQADYVLLGCWTSGLFIILQHPNDVWNNFAAQLPSMPEAKLALFTTYKLLTGSMFKNMYKQLNGRFASPALELKSKDGLLSEEDKAALDQFVR